ncbi:carbohydrate ABC transporter permease [Paenibacillaceae bacterium WGS1546]|uniref:carbohydrate ABC transporter permease n=1 Tax=Cohnella sp. WGS1546 TaxID=3366810 RepID=UPI00372D0D30
MQWLSSLKARTLFLTPTFLIYTLFIIVPIGFTVYYSFTNFSGIGSPDYVGFQNYERMFHDKLFFIALKNTLIILLVSFVMLIVFSFLIALMLNKSFKGNSLSKAMIFSPYVIAPIIVGTIWMFIFNPQYGLVNVVLEEIGLGSWQQVWIGGKSLTPWSIGFVFSWQVLGFHATIFLAGMKMIPGDVYEAASIDGASKTKMTWFVTIPMMRETFVMNVILMITGALKIYELAFQMTGGGPNHLSEVLVSYMYYTVFTSSQYGYGMAIAVFILAISIIGSFLYIRNAHRRNRQEG